MNVKVSPRAPGADDPAYGADDVNWLPRARLRAGARRRNLLKTLIFMTVCLLVAAAGFAAWTSQGEFAKFLSADKSSQRAPAPRAQPQPQPQPPSVQTAAQTPAISQPVRSVTPGAAAPPRPVQADARPPAETRPAPEVSAPEAQRPVANLRLTADGQVLPADSTAASAAAPVPVIPLVPPPAVDLPHPIALGSAPPSAQIPPQASAPPSAPLALGSAAPRTPEPAFTLDAPREVDRQARAAPPRVEPPASPAPQRVAAAPAFTPPPGSKVAIYLDEYPDQKAAAAGLSQKAGAYGRHIGSAGKLTYSRRLGNEWRLRVGNLDQAEAQALCAKLSGAGAPCAIGPN